MRQLEKVGTISPSLDINTTQQGCDLCSSAMLSAQLYTLRFQALWISGSENYNIKHKETED